jgi:hypothetical protein
VILRWITEGGYLWQATKNWKHIFAFFDSESKLKMTNGETAAGSWLLEEKNFPFILICE